MDCAQLEVNDVCVVLTRKETEQVAVDIVTAERDLEKYAMMAKRREEVAEAYYQVITLINDPNSYFLSTSKLGGYPPHQRESARLE